MSASPGIRASVDAPAVPPPVLLVVLDTVRPDRLSCYGHHRPTTPNLERLCEDATRYTRAFSTSAWTPPAHASIFTGLYPSGHRLLAQQDLPADVHTLPEVMRSGGYATSGTSTLNHLTRSRGFDRGLDRHANPFDGPTIRLPVLGRRRLELSREFLSFAVRRALWRYDACWHSVLAVQRQIRAAGAGRPFFAFVNLNSAHNPYRPPRPFAGRFASPLAPAADRRKVMHLAGRGGYQYMAGGLQVSEAEWEAVRAIYDEGLLYTDYLVGRLISFLRRRELYDRTLLIVTADHAEAFGEHGLAYHQFGLYDVNIRVPLIVKWPAGFEQAPERGGTDDRMASLVDLAPTISQVAGVSWPGTLNGVSLLAPVQPDRPVFAEYCPAGEALGMVAPHAAPDDQVIARLSRPLQAVRLPGHKYVLPGDGSEELYDLEADPGEERNIVADRPELAESMRGMIAERLKPPEQWLGFAADGDGRE
ncbi:MAG TPA: sulfatase [Armatimonadota bacterium]|nr:sulfatase [Armatimonadota bacterium]